MDAHEKLIEKLFSVGERLPPRIKDEILSRGVAVEPQLRRLIDDDALFNENARGKGWAPLHAVALLGAMRATESIPRLIALLASSDCDEHVWDRSTETLKTPSFSSSFPFAPVSCSICAELSAGAAAATPPHTNIPTTSIRFVMSISSLK